MSEWEQMIEQFKNEIGLPIRIGFYDSSYGNDICPSMANDYLGIQSIIDYPCNGYVDKWFKKNDPDVHPYLDI